MSSPVNPMLARLTLGAMARAIYASVYARDAHNARARTTRGHITRARAQASAKAVAAVGAPSREETTRDRKP